MRVTSRWAGYKNINVKSEDEIHSVPLSEPCIVGMPVAGGWFDLLCDFAPDSDTLVVVFKGAIDREKEPTLPNFAGLNLLKPFNVSKLFIGDPSLYLNSEMQLSWYAGSRLCDVRGLIYRTLTAFVQRLGIKRLVFLGGSGGGYACLWFSSFFPGSLAVVWNPQTDIMKYGKGHVGKYASVCFNTTIDGLASCLETSLLRRYAGAHENFILYLQNSLDWHVNSHMKPFISSLGLQVHAANSIMPLSDRVFLYGSNEWGSGHRQPPAELLHRLLGVALSPPSFEEQFLHPRFAG